MSGDLKFIYKVRKVIKFMIVQNITSEHFNTKEMGASRKKSKNALLVFSNNNKK